MPLSAALTAGPWHRPLVARRRTAYDQWPFKGPSVSSVRSWLKAGEAEGVIERAGTVRTGKPGRPAHLWQVSDKGKERAAAARSLADMRSDLQAQKVARMHGLSLEAARLILDRAAGNSLTNAAPPASPTACILPRRTGRAQ
jgi:predicted ArsR family transcriptional regulator